MHGTQPSRCSSLASSCCEELEQRPVRARTGEHAGELVAFEDRDRLRCPVWLLARLQLGGGLSTNQPRLSGGARGLRSRSRAARRGRSCGRGRCGDSADRPAAAMKRNNLHLVLPCQHRLGPPLVDGASTATLGSAPDATGPPPLLRVATAQRRNDGSTRPAWGIPISRSRESGVSAGFAVYRLLLVPGTPYVIATRSRSRPAP